jgi:hypothetical protein
VFAHDTTSSIVDNTRRRIGASALSSGHRETKLVQRKGKLVAI